MHILRREDRWCERGVKEAIDVKLEKTSLNGGGGLSTYKAALFLLPRQFHNHSHPGSCDLNSPFQAGGQLRGENVSNNMEIIGQRGGG